jgi:hypothetical protein
MPHHHRGFASGPDPLSPAAVRAAVEARLLDAFGEPTGRASVTFLGADRIEVLRFGPGTASGTVSSPADPALVRYSTLGMSAAPMSDPLGAFADPVRGPRAELLLSVRGGRDDMLRTLAAFAAAPQVEGLVVIPGAALELGAPLWPGGPFRAVLVGEPGGLLPDLDLPDPADPVRFLPLLPMTPAEAAYKRVHGAAALQDRWLTHGTDLRDPQRRAVRLD